MRYSTEGTLDEIMDNLGYPGQGLIGENGKVQINSCGSMPKAVSKRGRKDRSLVCIWKPRRFISCAKLRIHKGRAHIWNNSKPKPDTTYSLMHLL